MSVHRKLGEVARELADVVRRLPAGMERRDIEGAIAKLDQLTRTVKRLEQDLDDARR